MKINIKSNKGVTITGLVIYVTSFFMICTIIGIITTFFHNNTKVLSSEATASAEFDILNAYIAKDVKREDNIPNANENEITFPNGNIYMFVKENDEDYGKIYLCNKEINKYFVVANYIDNATFRTPENTNILEIEIEILGKSYVQNYNLTD